jgi:TAG lipase/steryl ester hydrolase/phospholipase A2/LPA acyltransferase
LSGGAYLGYYHLGLVRALYEEGLLPRVMSGASAGSIMAAVIGTKTDQELRDLYDSVKSHDDLPTGLRTDFFRFSSDLKSEAARRINYLFPQGLRWIVHPFLASLFDKKILNLDTEHFKKCLMQNCGLYTFQEAFDRTGRIINIIVAPSNIYDPPRLLNYLTAPHVCVWSAAAASCAIPGVFDPIHLIIKEPNGQFRPENEWTRSANFDSDEAKAAKLASYSDGSLENDLPMEQLSELFNVNHFIISQVNPHSAFLSSLQFKQRTTNFLYNALVGYMRFLSAQCRDWFKNIINFMLYRSNSPTYSAKRGITSALTQVHSHSISSCLSELFSSLLFCFIRIMKVVSMISPLILGLVTSIQCKLSPPSSRYRDRLTTLLFPSSYHSLHYSLLTESEWTRV